MESTKENIYVEKLYLVDPQFASEQEEFLNTAPYDLFSLDMPQTKAFKDERESLLSVGGMWKLAYDEYNTFSLAASTTCPKLSYFLNPDKTEGTHPFSSVEEENNTFMVFTTFPILYYRSFNTKYILDMTLKNHITFPFVVSQALSDTPFGLDFSEMWSRFSEDQSTYIRHLLKYRTVVPFTHLLFGSACSLEDLVTACSSEELYKNYPVLNYLIESKTPMVDFIIKYQSQKCGSTTDEDFQIFSALFGAFDHSFTVSKLIQLMQSINTDHEDTAIAILIAVTKQFDQDSVGGFLRNAIFNPDEKPLTLSKAIRRGHKRFLSTLLSLASPSEEVAKGSTAFSISGAYLRTLRLVLGSGDNELFDVFLPYVDLDEDYLRVNSFPIEWNPSLTLLKRDNSLYNVLYKIFHTKGVEYFIRFTSLIEFRNRELAVYRKFIEECPDVMRMLRMYMTSAFRKREDESYIVRRFITIVGFDRRIYEMYEAYGWVGSTILDSLVGMPIPLRLAEKSAKFNCHLLSKGYFTGRADITLRKEMVGALYNMVRYAPVMFARVANNNGSTVHEGSNSDSRSLTLTTDVIDRILSLYVESTTYDNKDVRFFELLFRDLKVSPNTTYEGCSLLSVVCSRPYSEKTLVSILRVFLKHGADINKAGVSDLLGEEQRSEKMRLPPLLTALNCGHFKAAVYLIEKGADVSVTTTMKSLRIPNKTDISGDTEVEVMEVLLMQYYIKLKDFKKLAEMLESRGKTLNVHIKGIGNAIDIHFYNQVPLRSPILPYLINRGISPAADNSSGNALLRYADAMNSYYGDWTKAIDRHISRTLVLLIHVDAYSAEKDPANTEKMQHYLSTISGACKLIQESYLYRCARIPITRSVILHRNTV